MAVARDLHYPSLTLPPQGWAALPNVPAWISIFTFFFTATSRLALLKKTRNLIAMTKIMSQLQICILQVSAVFPCQWKTGLGPGWRDKEANKLDGLGSVPETFMMEWESTLTSHPLTFTHVCGTCTYTYTHKYITFVKAGLWGTYTSLLKLGLPSPPGTSTGTVRT